MNILLVTGVVAGGVGRHVATLTRGLTAAGHTVVVACPEAVEDQFGYAGLGAGHVPLEVGSRPHPLRDRAAVSRLRELLPTTDVVHAHGLRAGALATLSRGRDTTPRLVVTTHNGPPALPRRGSAEASVHAALAARLLYGQLERIVCRRADLVLGVSPDLVERAADKGARGAALAVVPAPLTSRHDPGEASAGLRAELGLDPATPVVLSVGRLAAQKQMATLVSTMVRVANLLPEQAASSQPVLLIAGEGPERAALERLLDLPGTREAVDVRLLGQRGDVPYLLAGADVVVSAATWEGQPVWLQEALGQGAAIVATRVGGTSQIVADAAVLVPPVRGSDDEDVLAAAIAAVLDDPTRRDDLRERALTRATDLPTEDDAISAALAAYLPGAPGDPSAPSAT